MSMEGLIANYLKGILDVLRLDSCGYNQRYH